MLALVLYLGLFNFGGIVIVAHDILGIVLYYTAEGGVGAAESKGKVSRQASKHGEHV